MTPGRERHLVLVGGGHAHVAVMLAFGRRPEPGVRITLVTRDLETVYSGMLPGLVAGRYTRSQARIDLRALADRTGVALIHGEVDGLDLERRAIRAGQRDIAHYDLVSLDTGSLPEIGVPGAARFAVPVKPVPAFLDAVEGMRATTGASRIVVVGGGVGGAELALALQSGLARGQGSRVTLVTRESLTPELNGRAQRLVREAFRRHEIDLVKSAEIVAVDPVSIMAADGRRIAYDHLVWATWASAPAWLRDTGLALDERGFVTIEADLRAVGRRDVFAVGDVATSVAHPRPKAGVFVVRQGKPLADNLRLALRGEGPRAFTPQKRALALIGTADGRAIAAKGGFACEGAWVWWLKRWIDRRWIARYQA